MKFIKVIAVILVALLLLSGVSALLELGGSEDAPPGTSSRPGFIPPVDNTPEDPEPDEPEAPELSGIREDLLSFGAWGSPKTYTYDDSLSLSTRYGASRFDTNSECNTFTHDMSSESITGGQNFDILIPKLETGVYSLKFDIEFIASVMATSNGLVFIPFSDYNKNIFHNDNLSTYGSVTETGRVLSFDIVFDFNLNAVKYKVNKTDGTYKEDVFSLDTFSGADNKIIVRYEIAGDVDSTNLFSFRFTNVVFDIAEDDAIIPDDPSLSNPVIDGNFEILGNGSFLNLNEPEIALANGGSIQISKDKLGDFAYHTDETGEYYYMLDYVGSGSGKYSEFILDLHLPNYESGTYVLTQELRIFGETDNYYPTFMDIYIKERGALSPVTDLYHVNTRWFDAADILGVNFDTEYGGCVTVDYVFDFDNDVLTLILTDNYGKSLSEDFDISDYNNKNSQITLRYTIPVTEGGYNVNPNNTGFGFFSWSYKKLII